MPGEQGGKVKSGVKLGTGVNNKYIFIVCGLFSRYFTALSEGECLPVKDRLEMNVATQKTDTGLTPGLLKILHKQVPYSNTTRCLILFKEKQCISSIELLTVHFQYNFEFA